MQNKNTIFIKNKIKSLHFSNGVTISYKNGCLSGTNYRITFLTYFIYFCMNNSCWQSNERNVQNNFFLFHRTKETDHWQLEVLWLKRHCMLSYFYALPKAPTMCYWHRSHPTYYQRLLHPLKCEQRSIELLVYKGILWMEGSRTLCGIFETLC